MPKSYSSSLAQEAKGSNKESVKTYKIYILWRKLVGEQKGCYYSGASERCPRTQALRHLWKPSHTDIP
jgi:hypothetical protein